MRFFFFTLFWNLEVIKKHSITCNIRASIFTHIVKKSLFLSTKTWKLPLDHPAGMHKQIRPLK